MRGNEMTSQQGETSPHLHVLAHREEACCLGKCDSESSFIPGRGRVTLGSNLRPDLRRQLLSQTPHSKLNGCAHSHVILPQRVKLCELQF